MTLRHLKVFTIVCEEKSITKASIILNVAQPAISQTIKELENYYKVILFNRINQRLVLTESGKELYIKAKEILLSFEEFEDLANNEAKSKKIRFGTSLTISSSLSLDLLKYIRDNYEGMKIYNVVNNGKEILDEISIGNLDFGIIEGGLDYPNLIKEELLKDKLKVVCGINFDCKSTIEISDLSNLPLLLREKGSSSRDYLDNICKNKGISISPIMESISNNSIISTIKENFGVSILPELIVNPLINSYELKEIKLKGIELTRTINIIRLKNKKLTKEQMEIYNMCKVLIK